MRLKAGSTILVPKTAASADNQITENIVETAQIALEADRGEGRRHGHLTGAQRFKASAANAIAEFKSRVSHKTSQSHGRKHR